MPCTIGFNEQDKILEVIYRGEMAGPELRASTHEILTTLMQRKLDRVLLDCSEAHFDVPALSVYQLPDVYEARGLSRQARAAVLMPKDGYRKDLFEFYEDVCTNRGYFVKLFTDVPTARAWLKEP